MSNLANTAIISKDILSELVQGNFISVAINFSLLSSSYISGKISNSLLLSAEERLIASNQRLPLQNELDYDGKLAIDLLADQKIFLNGKNRFLGNAMKAAAPFVARGTTLYFAYNLVQGFRNNQTDFLDNLSNAAIVGLDVSEAGIESLEYLGYFAEISEFTGPVGEGLGLAIIVGMEIYHVEETLKTIQKWVHLSNKERFVQGIRTFFNFRPSEYLEKKANNEQLANRAINFLKLHSEIQYYLFSTGLSHNNLSSNNFVFLDRRRNIVIDRDTVPERPTLSDFFCLEGMRPPAYANDRSWIGEKFDSLVDTALEEISNLEEKNSFLCINTSGIEYPVNRTNNITLVALEGNASVIGPDSTTIYVINDGNHTYIAGDEDDLIILQGTNIKGSLFGGKGTNIIKFSEYKTNVESLLIDQHGVLCERNRAPQHGASQISSLGLDSVTNNYSSQPSLQAEIVIVMPNGSLVTHHNSNNDVFFSHRNNFCLEGVQLNNITQLYGRINKQDYIYVSREITALDANGGENDKKPDYIYIPENTTANLTITLRSNTIVYLSRRNATNYRINYKIPYDSSGRAEVKLFFDDETVHQFYFDSQLEAINSIEIKPNKIIFQVGHSEGDFKLTIQDLSINNVTSTSDTVTSFFAQNSMFFVKNLLLELVNQFTLNGKWSGNSSVSEIIQALARLSQRIQKNMLIETLQNEAILIGSNQQKVLRINGQQVRHVVGSMEDCVYEIQAPENFSESVTLNTISIYNIDRTSFNTKLDTLDFSKLLQKLRTQCNEQTIDFTIIEEHDDLELTLLSNSYYSKSLGCIQLALNSFPLIKVILKNVSNNAWYENIDIILNKYPQTLTYDFSGWKLVTSPLVFSDDKKIVVLTNEDLKNNEEVLFLRPIGQYYFINQNDTDLLFTNLFNTETFSDAYTIIFSNFYQNSLFREKVLSLTLQFLDEVVILNNVTQKIINATAFNPLISTQLNTSDIFLNQSDTAFLSNPTEQVGSRYRRSIVNDSFYKSSSTTTMPKIVNFFSYLPLKIWQLGKDIVTARSVSKNPKLYLQKDSVDLLIEVKKYTESFMQLREKKTQFFYCNKSSLFKEVNLEQPLNLNYLANANLAKASPVVWRQPLKRTKTTNLPWHDLRHTWTSWPVQNVTPSYKLQKLGG